MKSYMKRAYGVVMGLVLCGWLAGCTTPPPSPEPPSSPVPVDGMCGIPVMTANGWAFVPCSGEEGILILDLADDEVRLDAQMSCLWRAFEIFLARQDWDEAETALKILASCGADVQEASDRLKTARHIQGLRDKCLDMIQKGRFVDAELLIKELQSWKADVRDLQEQLRKAKAAKIKELDGKVRKAIHAGQFEKAEQYLNEMEDLGASTDALRDLLEQAKKIAALRSQFVQLLQKNRFHEAEAALQQLEALNASDVQTLREQLRKAKAAYIARLTNDFNRALSAGDMRKAFDILQELSGFGEDVEPLWALMRGHQREDVMAFEKFIEECETDRDFDEASRRLDAMVERWRGIPGLEIDVAYFREKLRIARILMALRAISSVGPLARDSSYRWWTIASVESLVQSTYLWIDGLRVQVLGVVTGEQASLDSDDIYHIMGVEGTGTVRVKSMVGVAMPGDYVYLLGIVRVRGNTIELNEARRFLFRDPYDARMTSTHAPTLAELRNWLNFDFAYAMENCFRRFVCVNESREALPILSKSEWADQGRRTTLEEVETFLGK